MARAPTAALSGAQDLEGQDLTNDETARKEARAVACDLAQNGNPATNERIVVTDAAGQVVHEEPLFRR